MTNSVIQMLLELRQAMFSLVVISKEKIHYCHSVQGISFPSTHLDQQKRVISSSSNCNPHAATFHIYSRADVFTLHLRDQHPSSCCYKWMEKRARCSPLGPYRGKGRWSISMTNLQHSSLRTFSTGEELSSVVYANFFVNITTAYYPVLCSSTDS